MVAALEEGYLLLQDPLQPHHLDDVLEPYVLSSAVTLEDRTAGLALISIPDQALAHVAGTNALWTSSPSCLGAGVDLLAPVDGHDALVSRLSRHLRPAAPADLEAWRVRAGTPRLGVDATSDDLPQEAGMESAVAFDKGCYLGQEAVARARNLGHPRRLLLALQAGEAIAAGEPVLIGGQEAGRVTSASRVEGSTLVLARVSWQARGGPFRTASGIELRPRRPL
jgi:folate-binding protein YgfZ